MATPYIPLVSCTRGGRGYRASCRLGSPPPCQELVKCLPTNFPEEELAAYVRAMLQDDRVEVR